MTWRLAIAVALSAPGCGGFPLSTDQMSRWAQRGPLVRAQDALKRGRYEQAIGYADRALRMQPLEPETEARIALLKGTALDELGQPRQAARLYRYVVALHGGSPAGSEAETRLEALAARGVDVSPTGWEDSEAPTLTSLQTSHQLMKREWLAEPVEIFYPYQAELEELEGSVLVQLESDSRGRLASWEVVSSSHPLFEDVVVRSLPRFKFVPEEMAKSDPPNTCRLQFTFRLRSE